MNIRNKAYAAGAALSALAFQASAALPTSVTSTVTAIQADMQSVFDVVFPVVAFGIGLAVTIKVVKRFTGKI